MPDTVGVVPNITIERRYNSVRQQTVFSSMYSGGIVLVMSDEERLALSAEHNALMEELQSHYGSRNTLFQLTPPIQVAFNRLMQAVFDYRSKTP